MFSRMLAAALIGLGLSAGAAEAQVVTSTANAGAGTLRNAINVANNNANLSVITFNLPAASSRTIVPAFDLPAFTAPVEIDGSGVLIDAVNTTRALELNTNNSLVRGFTIHDSSGAAAGPDGIQVLGNGNRLEDNHVGTDAAGESMGFWNLTTGVDIAGNGNIVQVGVIAESGGDGLAIAGNQNAVVGVRLGLPFKGGLGNFLNGVSVTGDGNRIGGMNTPDRNVIAENNDHGVSIAGDDNLVEGNYVGLDETGATGPGNVADGIHVVGDENFVRGNLSSNNDAGVFVDGTSNTIMSNTLGLEAIGNSDGVLIAGGLSNVVGDGNVITGNSDSGVEIEGGQNHRVEGNTIVANDDGVLAESSFNVIEDNDVTGNRDAGVKLDGAAAGPPPLGNVVDGNDLSGNEAGVVAEDSHRNAITGNTISGNLDEGVLIEAFNRPNADGNWLTGNTITENGRSGVRIEDGDDNLVGQPDHDVNTITGNGEDGVTVETGQDNAVVNNSISGNADLGIDLAADGASTNDGLLDLDAGPNGLQNHPKIDGRAVRSIQISDFPFFRLVTDVSWTLRTTASTDHRLELYGAEACDDTGRGEAPELLAAEQVTTDATGLATGTITLPTTDVPASLAMSATVTDPNGVVLGASSELSPCG